MNLGKTRFHNKMENDFLMKFKCYTLKGNCCEIKCKNINPNAHLITRQFSCLTSLIKINYFSFLLIVQPQQNIFILSQLYMPNRVFMKF